MSSLAKTALSIMVVTGFACTGEFTLNNARSGIGGADGGSGSADGVAFFEVNIRPMMTSARPKGTCANCHQGDSLAAGPDFLGANAASNYSNLLSLQGLVGPTAATSSFYSKGDHDGNAFLPAELVLVEQWILME